MENIKKERVKMKVIFLSHYWYLSICLMIFLVSSCKSSFHPLNNYNYFSGSTFYNDTINISAKYFGDIRFNRLKKQDIKNIKKSIKGIKEINHKNLLVYATTNALPEYNVFLFHKTLKNKTKDTTDTIELILNDTVRNRVLYKKSKRDKEVFVFLEAINNNKNCKSILIDGLTITESISFNIDFKKSLTFSKVFETYKDNTNYLLVREKLKNAPIPKSKKSEWMQFQYLATINSFMSNNIEYDSLINKFQESRKKYLLPMLDTLFNNSKKVKGDSTLKRIASLSKGTRVVMLNENHWYPKHRILATKLLKLLKNTGYTHLALEALYNNQDSILNNGRLYPKISSGYYTREPFFAHLIRKAKTLGFTIIGYENYNNSVNRELGQAQNIEKVLANNPKSKMFVYAGLAQINENNNNNNKGKRMATYFKELQKKCFYTAITQFKRNH